MNVESLILKTNCNHLEKRIIERISRGVTLDKRPDLIVWVCNFPLPDFATIQCPVIVKGIPCPHGGPYSSN